MTSSRWDLSKSEGKVEKLFSLLKDAGRKPVLILMHNNPDPDTIAGSLGLSFLIRKKLGIRSVLGFGGIISRAENKAMVQRLRIDMKPLKRVRQSDYYGVALVDSQPGTGNNLYEMREEPPLVVVDHHPLRKASLKSPFHDIRSQYGASSTIITEYILAAGITPTRSVANALLYAIKADTNSLLRSASKADYEAFNYLSPLTNPRVLGRIERPRLSQAHLMDYQRGLSRTTLYKDVAIAEFGSLHSEDIVPELADTLLRIEGVNWSLCVGRTKDMLILSVRSSSRSQQAGNIVRRTIGKLGSAGGHRDMAAGQILLNDRSDTDADDLTHKLIQKFLKLLDRQACQPQPLVE